MQFKGSVRAPGDRDPGVRVVLDIDEYHLEIRRDSELFGRYYLADVEVARDIAERFILFLGDDEIEFLADDALQFAYGGVTAMQDAWLEAQKKKRRHRRAAEASARRKDDQPRSVDLEASNAAQPLHVSESDAVRRRRLQGGTPTRPMPSPGRQAPSSRTAYSSTPSPDNGNIPRREPTAPDVTREVKEPTMRPKAPTPMPPLVEPATFEDIVEDELLVDDAILDGPIFDEPVPEEVVAQPVASEYFEESDEVEIEDTSLAARRRKITARANPEAKPDTKREARAKPKPKPETKREAIPEPLPEGSAEAKAKPETKPVAIPEPQSEGSAEAKADPETKPEGKPDTQEVTDLEAVFVSVLVNSRSEEAPSKGQRKAKPKGSDLGRVRLPEPVSARNAQPAAEEPIAEPAREKVADGLPETAGQGRFAQEGHHPFETNTGLLAKLRGQPRRPSNHVHNFKESGSSVGLVRRVCTECAYVSIGSDD